MNISRLLGTDQRTILLRKNIIAGIAIKGWSGLAQLIVVPLTLSCLGEYNNGVWMAIYAILLWMDNLDIGLGNGMRNLLAAHLAHGDTTKAREAVSSTFFMLTMMLLPVCAIMILLVNTIDLYSFLGVNPQATTQLQVTVSATIICVCATLIFKFIGSLYNSLQLPAVNNLMMAIGHTLMVLGMLVLNLCGSHSLLAVALVNTLSPLTVFVCAYPYTFYKKYPHLRPSLRLFKWDTAKALFALGIRFFALQMSAAIILLSANILLSRHFSPTSLTHYQVAYRYLCIVVILFSVICSPYWSATTDAYSRGDMKWIEQSTRRMERILCGIFIVLAVMVLLSDIIFRIWVGKYTQVPTYMTTGISVFFFIQMCSMAYCYYLNGMGFLRLQLFTTIGSMLCFIPLAEVLLLVWHHPLMVLVSLCVTSLPNLLCNKIQVEKILRGTMRGIWAKRN